MNVLAVNSRRRRAAGKRGVSPIIATILLVAISVVLAAVLYALISGLTGGGVGSRPIGSAFDAGSPMASKCTASYAYAANGCQGGDYVYNLTVETTGPTFASVLFEVRTSAGAVFTTGGVGGFTILTITGKVAAQMTTATAALAMTSTFGTYGASPICNGVACNPSTSFSSAYTIEIDMGTTNPNGLGFQFVAIGTGSYSGTTPPVTLQ
ncbi:MAG: archaellin/type IV pilin N-terminal domain-containing protein [Thermoplasmata archaeon]